MNRFLVHISLAVLTAWGLWAPCSEVFAAAPELNSLSPNPAYRGQLVAMTGNGFSMSDKILVDNNFISPINMAREGQIITFIVPDDTPIRDAGVGVAVKNINGEFSLGLNLKVVNKEVVVSKPQSKKATNVAKSKSRSFVVTRVNKLPQKEVKQEVAVEFLKQESNLANILSTLHSLVYRLSRQFAERIK